MAITIIVIFPLVKHISKLHNYKIYTRTIKGMP